MTTLPSSHLVSCNLYQPLRRAGLIESVSVVQFPQHFLSMNIALPLQWKWNGSGAQGLSHGPSSSFTLIAISPYSATFLFLLNVSGIRQRIIRPQ